MTGQYGPDWKCDQCSRTAQFMAQVDSIWCHIPNDRPGACQGKLRAHPAPDSRGDLRAEKLSASYRPMPTAEDREFATAVLRRVESAGLLVLDPKSDELVERIAREIARGKGYLAMHPATQEHYRERARAVLSTLAAPGGEPTP